MWNAFSRIFNKKNTKGDTDEEETIMDKLDGKNYQENETLAARQAKQRATVKWMLSKAFNNRVPENLREPFYRNHEDQEHLRPQLVHCLANAELYCMALSNIFSDPNFNNLNHGGVLQALARKGVYISDPHITETVLIQTTPIKLSAHQVVMQAVMTLYAKEVATPEFVYAAVKRLMPSGVELEAPQDYEGALLFWINQVTTALKLRADQEDAEARCPEFHKVTQLQDLCDGASLAGLVSFYCPEELHWSSICVSQLPTVPDCVRNLTLVSDFCHKALPYNIFHTAPEDIYYMRGSMKHNLVVFLADLFNVLEIHPAPCVTLSAARSNAEGRNLQGVAHKRSLPQAVSAIPDLRSGLDTPSSFSGGPAISSSGSIKKNHSNQHDQGENRPENDDFVVHRGRGVTTLSSVIGGGESKTTEAAGKPTHWEPRKQSFAGRRSRRNSLSEDSQLTLENFGGSQENLHLLGRNPDKEPAILPHSGRRESIARSSVLDNNSDALHFALQETCVKQQAPEATPRVTLSRNNSFIESQRRAEETRSSAGIQQLLFDPSPPHSPPPPIPVETRPVEKEKKVTTFAALPNNTTTWQQQSMANQNNEHQDNGTDAPADNSVMGSQLMNIRLKLEEKRRRIEVDKRRMEAQLSRQRQKVGKAAFLQAVSKDITEVEQKWLANDGFTEERKTPDMENMDIETYQQSIAQMNSSLHEIQADLQRLANQQNQLQSNPGNQVDIRLSNQNQIPANIQPPPQAPMQSFASLHQQGGGFSTQHINFNNHTPNYQQQPAYNNQPYPQIPNQQNNHEYFNGGRPMNSYNNQQMQQMHSLMSTANQQQPYNNSQQWHSLSQQQQQQPNYNTYSPSPNRYNQGFTLHNYEDNYANRQEKSEFYLHEPQPQQRRNWGQPYSPETAAWSRREPSSLSSSPKQSHFLHNGSGDNGSYRTSSSPSLAPTPPPRSTVNHAPLPTPPVDDMEPQSISFIGDGEEQEELTTGLSKLNITSGNRTYRIPSPTRNYAPVRNSFSQQHEKPEQGFYISFDDTNNQPKRPKPPLRTKRNSPKKERALTQILDTSVTSSPESKPRVVNSPMLDSPAPAPPPRAKDVESRVPALPVAEPIVIGNPTDPGTLDEMEKKKERILMLSLQRRQAAEEARNRKEAEAARKRDQEKAKEEEKLRKKEEEKRRRAQILEQYKIKKAIDEAERDGKTVDKDLLHSLKASLQSSSPGSSGPKMRNKPAQSVRPRPKTIHIDSGADAHDGTMTPSRGKKGSSSNLSAFGTPMRRDYYRGSQDCLTERKSSSRLYPEMGDESRGTSPGRSLGRRSSYKTSRDPSPEVRTMGRSKYGTYQARRKSNSLMNLAGSSCDQDSLAYRYGDTDSGLGRATPPRRVPSPSGPGSLPASHRRRFDDNMSDAGSDYNGPRLYRQPTTKSNKGIVLNAVEYCVFPGVVNREAKMRVIEEMNRSEAKHFLVLFRDAGCQFRALYAYYPDTEEIIKMYGTGPKVVTDRMFDKFFKYNSGGKCFSQVHTKHLTVTIDAFTIHNSLWQGKKVNLPNKRDMTLVI